MECFGPTSEMSRLHHTTDIPSQCATPICQDNLVSKISANELMLLLSSPAWLGMEVNKFHDVEMSVVDPNISRVQLSN